MLGGDWSSSVKRVHTTLLGDENTGLAVREAKEFAALAVKYSARTVLLTGVDGSRDMRAWVVKPAHIQLGGMTQLYSGIAVDYDGGIHFFAPRFEHESSGRVSGRLIGYSWRGRRGFMTYRSVVEWRGLLEQAAALVVASKPLPSFESVGRRIYMAPGVD
jgi:hypothetical protein